MKDVQTFYAENRAAWRQWLAEHHAVKQSVWLVYDKVAKRDLSYDAIVEEALCFGWIDSVTGRVSDTQSKLYISRRKPKSGWSKINKARLEHLLASGLMTEAGLAAIAIAKQNGSWDALTKSDNLIKPPELIALFKTNAAASEFYEAMSRSSKRQILEWIYAAKKPETYLARINQTVELSARGIKARS